MLHLMSFGHIVPGAAGKNRLCPVLCDAGAQIRELRLEPFFQFQILLIFLFPGTAEAGLRLEPFLSIQSLCSAAGAINFTF